MKPLVAVTAVTRTLDVEMREKLPHATVNRRFGELIARAGGVPVFAGPDAEPAALAERVDALVINGGQDVDPDRYGAEPDANLGPVDPERDRFELELVRAARARQVPVLGVCRGMHVVNVACGGTLIQHLPDHTDLGHDRRDEFDRPVHEVVIEPGSELAQALGTERLQVNSVHHQAVGELGEGLRAVARTADGVIEAVEGDSGRTQGIQWHPEFLAPEHDPVQVGVFRSLRRSS